MTDLFNYTRRASDEVRIGNTPLGGNHPIRIQSMTTTLTDDTEASVAQAKRIIEAGGEYVRLTTQGIREAENLKNINARLREEGINTPLVADVHFNPKVADVAALYAEKVRINPGNYVDAARKFINRDYTDEEYAAELQKIEDRFIPFIRICKAHHTAIRIGVNHGSLSDRIMSRYGDTPEGIVESCMEFLRVCQKEHFTDVVISIKASNTVVMVCSVRLLVERMAKEGLRFPLHLGVTEAGEGEDGRIKSAVGIGALLADGIGDTIRVSLSEDPEKEIPVGRHLADYISKRSHHTPIPARTATNFNWLQPERRTTVAVNHIGGSHVPVVILSASSLLEGEQPDANPELCPDYLYCGREIPSEIRENLSCIVDYDVYEEQRLAHPQRTIYPIFPYNAMPFIAQTDAPLKFLVLQYGCSREEYLACLKAHPEVVAVCLSLHQNRLGEQRALVHDLMNDGVTNPVIFVQAYHHSMEERSELQLEAAADMGALCIDGLVDGIWLMNEPLNPEKEGNGKTTEEKSGDEKDLNQTSDMADNSPSAPSPTPFSLLRDTSFGILQAARLRTSKTEYISCPGCGRTLYDLRTTIARIKEATRDMKGLKIGIMGCIVNGPGEMADADYGYVGAGRGRISLYRKKECVERNIPEEEAVERLLRLIKEDRK